MLRSAALIFAAGIVFADPPGAIVSQQIAGQRVSLPPGFVMSVWAQIAGARFLAVAPNGDVFVSQPGAGQISVLRPDRNGGAPLTFVYARGLNGPQGLAFATVDGLTWLYVGEETQIDRYAYRPGDTSASEQQVLVSGLEGNDAHPFKDIAIGPDQTVYFGYGSSGNVSPGDVVAHPALGAIYSMNPDGSNLQLVASGLRNPEGLAVLPGTNTLWTAVNGRDDIPYPFDDGSGKYGKVIPDFVDNHPPDLFTNVISGANYGWPFCNSNPDTPAGNNNPPFDPDYDTNADRAVDCSTMTRPAKGLQAHSAPLGFAFLQGTAFAAPYANGAVMAYHGSWDRSAPTGYKVVYFPWDSLRQTAGDPVDFITGFLGWGRPVDVAVAADGALLITDDQAGAVYRLSWAPSAVSAANGYPVIAPGSYATVYGANLPVGSAAAATPYPTTLGGASLSITDAGGASFPAALVYVSPMQINFIVPDGLASGTAQLTLNTGDTSVSLGAPQIAAAAPGLFSLSGNGSGTAAALAVDSQHNAVSVFSCGGSGCSAVPINVSAGPVYLSLYGTGIRGANGQVVVTMNGVSVPVSFAGPQGTEPGLDQVNVAIPASFAGAGTVEVQVAAGNARSNVVAIGIK